MINNNITFHSLLTLAWISNKLINHRNELLITLQNNRIDITLISETHFTNIKINQSKSKHYTFTLRYKYYSYLFE